MHSSLNDLSSLEYPIISGAGILSNRARASRSFRVSASGELRDGRRWSVEGCSRSTLRCFSSFQRGHLAHVRHKLQCPEPGAQHSRWTALHEDAWTIQMSTRQSISSRGSTRPRRVDLLTCWTREWGNLTGTTTSSRWSPARTWTLCGRSIRGVSRSLFVFHSLDTSRCFDLRQSLCSLTEQRRGLHGVYAMQCCYDYCMQR